MSKINSKVEKVKIPDGFVVFISGVPGVGKTTISYELLKKRSEFKIVQETDLVREILRGYNDYLLDELNNHLQPIDKIEITGYNKLLSYDEAKQQCIIMKKSFENILLRQQRKRISSIINGVHVIPEIMDGLAENYNVIYINLYINNESEIYNRLLNRNPESYMLDYIPLIYQTNIDLYLSMRKLSKKAAHIFHNIDVTTLSLEETINEMMNCINSRIVHTNSLPFP